MAAVTGPRPRKRPKRIQTTAPPPHSKWVVRAAFFADSGVRKAIRNDQREVLC